jgi:holo-[acyl-carrier protein] synthase
VDVIELSRLKQAMRRGGAAFMRRIFTPHEEAYAKARRQTTLLHLAGRFAAKEAVIKAISQVDPKRVPTMKQVEIRNDRLGRPRAVLLDGRPTRLQIYVSLSHVDTVAVASAIVVKR